MVESYLVILGQRGAKTNNMSFSMMLIVIEVLFFDWRTDYERDYRQQNDSSN